MKSLKHLYCLLTFILMALSVYANDTGPSHKIPTLRRGNRETMEHADSIMHLVIDNASFYQKAVSNYEAEIYTKGRSEILKKNILIHFAHHLFPTDRKNKDLFFEMVTQSKYDAPNTYFHDVKAVNGNSIPNAKRQQEAMAFLNINVYSPTAYDDAIFMPVASNAFKFYSFSLEEKVTTEDQTIYKISFLPKQWSQKLVCGYLYVMDGSWTIDKIDMNGRYSFAEFNLIMSYNRGNRRFILPEKADLYLRYKVMGNVVETRYHSSFDYQEVEWIEEDNDKRKDKSLDLTSYYKLSSDTIPILRDSAYWELHRDEPLSEEEASLYRKKLLKMQEEESIQSVDSVDEDHMYIKLTEQLTNTINMDYKSTRIKYSGILNPLQLGYSARNGVTYKQRIRGSKTFDNGQQIRFRPEIGYVFKRKQIFFKIASDWIYLPARMGTVSLEIANDNKSYSSEITNLINEELKDSTFSFSDLDLEYFKHYYTELKHSIELFNGFQLSTSLSYHRRIPSNTKVAIDPGKNVMQILSQNYNDFTPAISITYTPRQYYRMDGNRKEYVYSYYPTISIEYARGIPGVGKSTGDYDRIEADIHQSLLLGLSRRLNYHVSGGLFARQHSTYFADFRYFARRNFPDSWEDQIGGVFNLLKSEWFNATTKYLQAHFMYESPFVLMNFFPINSTRRFMRTAARYVMSERFYWSQLWTPVLPSYTEIGYGIGNYIFNIAVFASFDRWHYQSMGLKFAFELFK